MSQQDMTVSQAREVLANLHASVQPHSTAVIEIDERGIIRFGVRRPNGYLAIREPAYLLTDATPSNQVAA
jgi:hypothetical protein